jgi:hypothetical protein
VSCAAFDKGAARPRNRLEEAIAKTRYAEDARSRHLAFFARKGFTDELRKIAETDAGVCLFEWMN